LSKEDKQRVQDGRAASAAATNNQSVSLTHQPKWNIASVTAEDDAVSAITAATEALGVARGSIAAQSQSSNTSTAGQSMS